MKSWVSLNLSYPNQKLYDEEGKEVSKEKIKDKLKQRVREHNEVRANRVDARIVGHREETVSIIEMSCPWVENRGKKDEEKTLKYGLLRREMKAQYKGYKINQYNLIIDVLGGWSVDMERSIRKLLGKPMTSPVADPGEGSGGPDPSLQT
ncbi:hypothetical protein AWC38_SpisGene3718 [Stylophora pistillata]|uniref:Uncharacterized protein n=1 Tax=Stylophora pistillata TaxID=50429 RepID=A0A2B4SQQ5_STYPI|nr:hypothetical protein AWC38_SpisGene3718 [Stylophora pistillata]